MISETLQPRLGKKTAACIRHYTQRIGETPALGYTPPVPATAKPWETRMKLPFENMISPLIFIAILLLLLFLIAYAY